MVSMFLLDRSNLNYYTCCGSIHCKLALLGLICFSIFCQIVNVITFFNSIDDEYKLSDAFFQLIETLITSCSIVAISKENAKYLIPFMFQMFLAFLIGAVTTFRVAVCVIFPNSSLYDDFIEPIPGTTTSMKIIIALFILAVMVTMTTFIAWAQHVLLTCYTYFEDKTADRKTRANRPPISFEENGRPPLVSSDPKTNSSSSTSFPNPNFATGEDDEDHIFSSKSTTGPVMV